MTEHVRFPHKRLNVPGVHNFRNYVENPEWENNGRMGIKQICGGHMFTHKTLWFTVYGRDCKWTMATGALTFFDDDACELYDRVWFITLNSDEDEQKEMIHSWLDADFEAFFADRGWTGGELFRSNFGSTVMINYEMRLKGTGDDEYV